MKKVIALMLTIIMALTICIVPASATNGSASSTGNIVENAIEDFFKVTTGVDEDAEITVSDDLVEEVSSYSVNHTAAALSEIVFVKASDVEDDPTLAALLDDTDCTVAVLDDGSVELYIAINLEEHPELFNIDTFRSYVKAVVDNTDEYYKENGYDPETTDATLHYDSYLRFAGELALHMIVYEVLFPFSGFVKDSYIDELENHAVDALMNTSESRAPEWVFIAVGWFFMNLASKI